MFLTLTVSVSVWGQSAEINSILWQESFTGTTESKSTTFAASSADAISKAADESKGTAMFQSADITSLRYTASNVMLTASDGTNCTAAHIWLNKKTTAYFQAEGIPLYGATKVCIMWNQGGASSITAHYKLDDGDWTSIKSTSTAAANITSSDINTTNKKTIAVKFVRTSTTTNIRLDDLRIKVTEAAPSCTNPTISWATAPANGNIGGTMTAKANTNYPAGLTYSSSNPSVATIDASGVIEYLKVGSTTITASVTGDGTTYCNKTVSVSKTITVTCGSKVTINTTNDGNGSITANPTSIETCSDNDGNRQITITLNPNSHYSSNAPTISGITNATITGSGNTYTVQLPKGSNGTLSVSASFKEDDKHIVTWSADGQSIKTEEVYVNEQVSVVPTISDIPEGNRCGDKFVGWTTEAIPTPQDDAPGYFTTAANSPEITDDITFYAVFADYANE